MNRKATSRRSNGGRQALALGKEGVKETDSPTIQAVEKGWKTSQPKQK